MWLLMVDLSNHISQVVSSMFTPCRVEAGIKRLAELNPHVIVKSLSTPFGKKNSSWDFLSEYKV